MPSWKDLKRFCEQDDWIMYKQTDHYYYRKFDNDGNYRQTKVSMGTGEISKNLWRHILNRQLQVTKEYFNEKI